MIIKIHLDYPLHLQLERISKKAGNREDNEEIILVGECRYAQKLISDDLIRALMCQYKIDKYTENSTHAFYGETDSLLDSEVKYNYEELNKQSSDYGIRNWWKFGAGISLSTIAGGGVGVSLLAGGLLASVVAPPFGLLAYAAVIGIGAGIGFIASGIVSAVNYFKGKSKEQVHLDKQKDKLDTSIKLFKKIEETLGSENIKEINDIKNRVMEEKCAAIQKSLDSIDELLSSRNINPSDLSELGALQGKLTNKLNLFSDEKRTSDDVHKLIAQSCVDGFEKIKSDMENKAIAFLYAEELRELEAVQTKARIIVGRVRRQLIEDHKAVQIKARIIVGRVRRQLIEDHINSKFKIYAPLEQRKLRHQTFTNKAARSLSGINLKLKKLKESSGKLSSNLKSYFLDKFNHLEGLKDILADFNKLNKNQVEQIETSIDSQKKSMLLEYDNPSADAELKSITENIDKEFNRFSETINERLKNFNEDYYKKFNKVQDEIVSKEKSINSALDEQNEKIAKILAIYSKLDDLDRQANITTRYVGRAAILRSVPDMPGLTDSEKVAVKRQELCRIIAEELPPREKITTLECSLRSQVSQLRAELEQRVVDENTDNLNGFYQQRELKILNLIESANAGFEQLFSELQVRADSIKTQIKAIQKVDEAKAREEDNGLIPLFPEQWKNYSLKTCFAATSRIMKSRWDDGGYLTENCQSKIESPFDCELGLNRRRRTDCSSLYDIFYVHQSRLEEALTDIIRLKSKKEEDAFINPYIDMLSLSHYMLMQYAKRTENTDQSDFLRNNPQYFKRIISLAGYSLAQFASIMDSINIGDQLDSSQKEHFNSIKACAEEIRLILFHSRSSSEIPLPESKLWMLAETGMYNCAEFYKIFVYENNYPEAPVDPRLINYNYNYVDYGSISSDAGSALTRNSVISNGLLNINTIPNFVMNLLTNMHDILKTASENTDENTEYVTQEFKLNTLIEPVTETVKKLLEKINKLVSPPQKNRAVISYGSVESEETQEEQALAY